MKFSKLYKDAEKAISEKRISELLNIAEMMISSDHKPAHPSGYLFKGMANELGGAGVPQDLDKAVSCYRQAAYLCPDNITYLFLARVLMKKGGASHALALRYLDEAAAVRGSPELSLAYANYYETAVEPDYKRSRDYYFRAMLCGRFPGFFGYSAVSRRMGDKYLASLVDCARIILGPIILIVFGRKSSSSF